MFSRLALGLMCVAMVAVGAEGHLPVNLNTLLLGYDCSHPTALDAFDRSSFCNLGRPAPKPGHPTASFEVAQVTWISETEGWNCHAVSTLTTHICGLWGYEKAVPSMSDRTLVKLTPAQCKGGHGPVQGGP